MRLKSRAALVALAVVATFAGACGQWAQPAPTAPSQFQHNPTTGANISGVLNGGSSSSSLLAAATSGMTVTVVGTDVSAAVSVSGKFILKGVPAGTVFLRFTGPNVDATVLVGSVADQDLFDLKLTVEGSSARIDVRVRIAIDNTTEIEGPVAAVSGTCPTLTIKVGDWTLNLDASSVGACSDLRIGIKIKIRGRREGNVVVVVRVEVEGGENDHDDDDDGHDDDDDDD